MSADSGEELARSSAALEGRKELKARRDQSSCYLRPPFPEDPSVPSRCLEPNLSHELDLPGSIATTREGPLPPRVQRPSRWSLSRRAQEKEACNERHKGWQPQVSLKLSDIP